MDPIDLINLLVNGGIFAGMIYAAYIQRDQVNDLRDQRDILQLWILDNTDLDHRSVDALINNKQR